MERKHNNANLMYRFYIAQPNIDVFAFKPFSSTSASFSAFIFHITCCMQIHTIRSTGCPRSMVFYTPHRKSMADIILFASEMRDLYSNWSNINVQIWLGFIQIGTQNFFNEKITKTKNSHQQWAAV